MMLKAVTYSSFASPGLQPGELHALLEESRRNNACNGVSGLLMFNGGAFVQTIEGPDTKIDALLARLAADLRHCAMEVRDQRHLPRRIFPEWTMGYVRLDGTALEGQNDVAGALDRYIPDPIRGLLMSMATTLPFA